MTETISSAPPRARTRKQIVEDLKTEAKVKKEHNVEAWIKAGTTVLGASATYSMIAFVAIPSFVAGGGWIVLGVFSCFWTLGLASFTVDQFGKFLNAAFS